MDWNGESDYMDMDMDIDMDMDMDMDVEYGYGYGYGNGTCSMKRYIHLQKRLSLLIRDLTQALRVGRIDGGELSERDFEKFSVIDWIKYNFVKYIGNIWGPAMNRSF